MAKEAKAVKEDVVEDVAPHILRERVRVAAVETVVAYLDEQEKLPPEIAEAANTLRRKRLPAGQRKKERVNNIAFLTDLFRAKKTLTEQELYLEHGLTKAEMGTKRKSALNNAATPEDRIWITYDADARTFTFKGKKEFKPKGYVGPYPTGYVEEEK